MIATNGRYDPHFRAQSARREPRAIGETARKRRDDMLAAAVACAVASRRRGRGRPRSRIT
jgi:hypothetical protein